MTVREITPRSELTRNKKLLTEHGNGGLSNSPIQETGSICSASEGLKFEQMFNGKV